MSESDGYAQAEREQVSEMGCCGIGDEQKEYRSNCSRYDRKKHVPEGIKYHTHSKICDNAPDSHSYDRIYKDRKHECSVYRMSSGAESYRKKSRESRSGIGYDPGNAVIPHCA